MRDVFPSFPTLPFSSSRCCCFSSSVLSSPSLSLLFCLFSSFSGKLREIEILCQEDESADATTTPLPPAVAELKKSLLAILYATDENAEFQVPDAAEATTDAAATEVAEEVAEEATGAEEGLLGSEELVE